MSKFLLSGNDWNLYGWAKNQWSYERIMETNAFAAPAVAKCSATVPGSVQTDLFNNGVIEDWNIQTNFRNIEWIENREWVYTKSFSITEKAEKYYLIFEGLDFNGMVFVNDKQVLEFNEMMIPYRVDVTDEVYLDKENKLKVVFLQPPEVDGQVGYTSKVSILKSRFNYGWDWCPRLVNIGIFRDVWLEAVDTAYIEDFYPATKLDGDKGSVSANLEFLAIKSDELKISLSLKNDNGIISEAVKTISASAGKNSAELELENLEIEKWFPSGFGKQPIYTAEICLCDKNGKILASERKQVGFRKIEYVAPENSPEGCLSYSVKINDTLIPLRGINWVPISPFYGSVREKDYVFFLERFLKMNCNIIRVWGGAAQETPTFYDLCDKYGIMVWQDFPQSSSGLDNAPNEDPAFIENLVKVSKQHVLTARSHVSLAYWCAGNELYYEPNLYPVDEETSDNVRALGDLVRTYNPEILYLPDTPSRVVDPRFPKGCESGWINGDAHGPWDYAGVENHYTYFYNQQSVLLSEVGAPSSARIESIKKYCTKDIWPPSYDTEFWSSRGFWWIRIKELTEMFGDFEKYPDKLAAYITASRFIQGEALKTISSAVRYFDKQKSGVLIWMGSEPFPNAQNTSLLEYDGYPKPSYYEIKKGFAHQMAGLKYDRPYANENGEVVFTPFLCSDNEFDFGEIRLSAFNENGEFIKTCRFDSVKGNGTIAFEPTKVSLKGEVCVVRIISSTLGVMGEWVFTNAQKETFAPLLRAKKCDLEITKKSDSQFSVKNKSDAVAFFNELGVYDKNGISLLVDKNFFCLLPGEEVMVKVDGVLSKIVVTQMNQL